jgi:hypothetical protein
MSAVLTQTLEPRIREMTPRVHAIMAQFSELVSAFEDSGAWQGAGMRSCADWLVVHAGFDRHTAESLLRAGHAARELPEIGEAFFAGELSLDKVRSLSTIATAVDQAAWVELARTKSPPQLAQVCREARNTELVDAHERAHAQRAAWPALPVGRARHAPAQWSAPPRRGRPGPRRGGELRAPAGRGAVGTAGRG